MIKGKHNAAVLLVGFASALTRSELVALEVDDLEETDRGLAIHLRRGKTDQEGEGRVVPLVPGSSSCPIQALNDWFEAAGIDSGPVFRSVNRHGRVGGSLTGHSVGQIVKAAAAAAGLEPESVGAHSLRAGFVTSDRSHRGHDGSPTR